MSGAELTLDVHLRMFENCKYLSVFQVSRAGEPEESFFFECVPGRGCVCVGVFDFSLLRNQKQFLTFQEAKKQNQLPFAVL